MSKISTLITAASMSIVSAIGFIAVQASAATTIKIATEGAWPPYNFVNDSGELVGYEVDLMNEVCARMPGYKCEIVQQDWDGIIPGLLARKYDAIMADMSITEERKRKVMFSDPYHLLPPLWVGKSNLGLSEPVSADQLSGLTVGCQGSTIFSNYLEDKMPNVPVKLYGKQDEVELDLAAGRIDLFIADQVLSNTFLKSDAGKNFQAYGHPPQDPIFGIGTGVAMRKGETAMLFAFNGALATVIQDGTMEQLWQKWFKFSYVEPATRRTYE